MVATDRTSCVNYLQQNGLPKFIDRMIRDLVQSQSDSPVDFMADWMDKMRPINIHNITVEVVSAQGFVRPLNCRVMLQLGNVTKATSTLKGTDAQFGETFALGVSSINSAMLTVTVQSKEKGSAWEFYGSGTISIKALPIVCTAVAVDVPLTDDNEPVGAVSLVIDNCVQPRWITDTGVKVSVLRGANLPAEDDTGFSDPYVELHLADQMRVTSVKVQTLNPTWNEDFVFMPNPLQDLTLHLFAWDQDPGEDPDFLGTASLDITQAPVEQELVVPLSRKSKGVEGSLVLKLSKAEAPRPPKGPPTAPKGVPPPTAHAGRAPPPPPEAPKAPGSAANGAHSLGAPAAAAQHGPVLAAPKAPLDRLPAPSPRAPGEAPPAIFVTVIELEGLCARAGAAANPFVTMRCGSEVMHSSVKVAADRPVWDERFLFLLKTLECDLSFDVWDKGETGQDLLGRGRVGLSDVVFGFPMPVALKTGDTPAGTLSVRLEDNVAQREWLPKFGLHITIVSGKGLGPQPHRTRADPSVQLDVGAGTWNTGIQRLTLDPEFGHRFHVPIETGEETVACTVIDNDMRPVIVGYGEVALQALSLAKSLRYDLPLKHNGDDAGFLTLLLEAGDSPGEVHALPPPPLPVKAKAPVRGIRVTVLSAEGLPVMDVGGRCDPYVQLVSGSCARRTTTIPQTLQPTWNETLYLATDPKVPVQLVVWDVDEGDEIELVGLAQVSVQDLGVDSWQVEEHSLQLFNKTEPVGILHIEAEAIPQEQLLPLYGLSVKAVEARGLPPMDYNGLCDPFVQFALGPCLLTTSVKHKTLHPVWNEAMQLAGGAATDLAVSVWDEDSTVNEFVGAAVVDLLGIDLTYGPVERFVQLHNSKHEFAGELRLVLAFGDPGTVSRRLRPKTPARRAKAAPAAPGTVQAPAPAPGTPTSQPVVAVDVHLKVARATGLDGPANPFAQLRLGSGVYTTNTRHVTSDPEWNETFFVPWDEDSYGDFTVWDRHGYGAELLGECQLSLLELLQVDEGTESTHHLHLDGAPAGQLVLCCEPEDVAADSGEMEVIRIDVSAAKVLEGAAERNPYVQIIAGQDMRRTETIRGTLSPAWDETFMVAVPKTLTHIEFMLWSDDDVGPLFLGAGRLAVGAVGRHPVPLKRMNHPGGELTVRLLLLGPDAEQAFASSRPNSRQTNGSRPGSRQKPGGGRPHMNSRQGARPGGVAKR